MANPSPPDSNRYDLTVYVDSLEIFDDIVITDPTELAALYQPTPKNLVVQVDEVQEFDDQAIPASTDLNDPSPH